MQCTGANLDKKRIEECKGLPFADSTREAGDRKSTRLNSSHGYISYAVFCLKKKKSNHNPYKFPYVSEHDHQPLSRFESLHRAYSPNHPHLSLVEIACFRLSLR